MIYLFNSAFRGQYRENILNTLYLPVGHYNQFQYRIKGEVTYVEPRTRDYLIKGNKKNEDVIIIFVNRYNENGYEYFPLRLAKLINWKEKDERIYLTVSLQEYVYPKKYERFQIDLKKIIPSLPRLTNNDPENSHDNYYVCKGKAFSLKTFTFGQTAWSSIVKQLVKHKYFLSNEHQASIFIRVESISESGGFKTLKTISNYDHTIFNITKGKHYVVRLFYYYAPQEFNPADMAKLKFEGSENIIFYSNEYYTLNTIAETIDIEFSTRPSIETKMASIRISCPAAFGESRKFIFPDIEIRMKIAENNIYLTTALFAYALITVAKDVDYSLIKTLTITEFILSSSFRAIVFSIFQTFILYWIFKLVGSKKVI